MSEIQITSSEGLIKSEIIPKKVVFYLVTDDNLKMIKSKSILAEVFGLIASLMWGTYFSIMTTLKISFGLNDNEKVILETLQNVFLWTGILFTALTLVFIVWNFGVLKQIKRNELEVDNTEESDESVRIRN